MLSVIHARKRFDGSPRDALCDVTFDVMSGSICCVIGRNGAGKSTLMSAIVGLHSLTAGDITMNGESLPASPAARQRVGYAGQSEALYPLLTGRENLTTFAKLAGLERNDMRRRIGDLADGLHISDILDRPVRTLSGGERRRVHVAVALLGDYDLVMLDEPTAGVDPVTRTDVLSLVAESSTQGITVLYSTHYLHEVEALDSDVVILEQGRILAAGTVTSLVAQHGQSWIDLSFAEPVDTTHLRWVHQWSDHFLRVRVQRPREELPRILESLAVEAVNLRSLEIHEPDLDGVFFDLTGRQLSEDDGAGGIS